jgi:hypothetical protein
MKINFIYIGIALAGIGFLLIGIVQQKQYRRYHYRIGGPLNEPAPDIEKKMVKIDAILSCLGIFIVIIIQKYY